MLSNMSVPICNHFHVRRANNGRITAYQGGCPSFVPLFVGTPFTQWHKILSQNTTDTRLSYGRNQNSLSHLVLDWYGIVMDGQKDGQNYHT